MALLPYKEAIYLENGGVAVTGQSANLKVRVSPYALGNVVAGLIFTETPALSGHYLISGFGDTGVDAYYPDIKIYLSAVEQTSFGIQDIGDPSERFLDKVQTAEQDILSDIDMNSKLFKNVAQGSIAGHVAEFLQAAIINATRTISALWTFSTRPTMSNPSGNPPTATGHFTDKLYVDNLFSGATGMVQSTYNIKLLPTRATEDTLSKLTVEACKTYLAGLTSIASIRGSIEIDSLGSTDNSINLDDGTTVWTADGVDINAKNKCVFVRRAPNDSITADSRIKNVHFHDLSVVASRTYVNFTFDSCDFTFTGTNVTFNNCKFKNYNTVKVTTGTLTFANCKGAGTVVHNDDVTPTITGTQPADIKGTASTNLGY